MDVYWEQFKTPFLCVAGHSGVGKTTLLEDLIQRFNAENFSVEPLDEIFEGSSFPPSSGPIVSLK